MSVFPKRCSCGREHYRGDWSALRFVGFMDDGEGGRLELRDCVCLSTIAIQVTPASLTDTLREDLAEVCRNDARELEDPTPSRWAPRREPTPEDRAEADRLHDIADELTGVDTRAEGRAA